MPKRIYTLDVTETSADLQLDVMRFTNPALHQRKIHEFIEKFKDNGKRIMLEDARMLSVNLAAMRRGGHDAESVASRSFIIDESSVVGVVRWIDYHAGMYSIQVRSLRGFPLDAHEHIISVGTLTHFSSADISICRMNISPADGVYDARYHKGDHSVGERAFLEKPRFLKDSEVPEGVELAHAMACDIVVWITHVYGIDNYKALRHEERLSMVSEVVTAHDRQFESDSLAVGAVLEMVDYSLGLFQPDTYDVRAVGIHNFNRVYKK